MSMLLEAKPMPLSEIEAGSLVLIDATWRRLERWEQYANADGTPRCWRVSWSGSLYRSAYSTEPTWMVWQGPDAPRTSGVAR